MRRPLAIALALGGLFVAVATMMIMASMLLAGAGRQPLWQIPAFYLVEAVALSGAIVLAVFTERPRIVLTAWLAVGALSALAVLGAMTIGPFIGIALLLLVPAVSLSAPDRVGFSRSAVAFLVGLALQAGGMFAVIQAMLRR